MGGWKVGSKAVAKMIEKLGREEGRNLDLEMVSTIKHLVGKGDRVSF